MRVTRASVMIAATLASAACYTMRPVTLDGLGARKGSRVWVTHQDQSVVVVNDGQVFRGKLVGFVDGKYRELAPADLQQMRVRQLAAGRTLSLIGAGALAFAVGVVLISGNEGTFDPCVGDDACDDMALVSP